MAFIIGFIVALLSPILALLGVDIALTYGAAGMSAVLGSLVACAVATDVRIQRQLRLCSLLPARQPARPVRLPSRGRVDISFAARIDWRWPASGARHPAGLSGDMHLDVNTLMARGAPSNRLLPAPAPSSRIVLIGQDADTRALLASLLGDEGWQTVACDQEDSFAFVRREGCEMVLFDLDGVPAGRPLIDLLILDPATSGVPIVACTSYPEQLAEVERRLGRQGVELLPKPFNADELYAAVRTVVNAARGTGQRERSMHLQRRSKYGQE